MKTMGILTDTKRSLAAKIIAVFTAFALIMSCFSVAGLAFAVDSDEPDVTGSSSTSTSGSLVIPGTGSEVAATDASYTIVHEYYTNGSKDGETREDITGKKVGDVVKAANITKVYDYQNKDYDFISVNPSLPYTLKDSGNIITLRYEKIAYTTNNKPNSPTHDEVYDLIGNVVVKCEPQKHGDGMFDCIVNSKGADHRDRIIIGDVQGNDHRGYTCTVTFLAEKFADAYSKLKSEGHELISGEGNKTVTFQFNADKVEWEAGNLTGPITFTVTCEEPQVYTVTYTDGVEGLAFADQVNSDLSDGKDTPSFVDDEGNAATPVREGYLFTGWSPVVSEKVNSNATYTAQWVPELDDQTVNRLVRGEKTDTSATVIVSCAPGHHAIARFDCYYEETEGDGINSHPGRIEYGEVRIENGNVYQNVTFLYSKYKNAYAKLKGYKHDDVYGQSNKSIEFVYEGDKWSRNDGSTSPVEFVVACDKHKWNKGVITTDPNCITPGEKTYTCECEECETYNNGKVTTTEPITATGHNFEGVEFVDNCETHEDENCTGHTKVCKNCNGDLDGGTIEEKHTFGEWTTKDATIDEEGAREHQCIVCGHKATETIPMLDSITVTWKDGYTDTSDESDADMLGQKKYQKVDEQIIPEEDFPQNPTRDDYIFNGWGDPETDDDGNITYTAQWEAVPEEPQPETPAPGTDEPADPTNPPAEDPAPGTPDEPATDPATPATPAPNGPVATPVAPVTAVPAAGPAAAPAAADEAAIDDEANPLAEAPEEQAISDEENALAGFDEPHCWVHILMIIGMVLTVVYGACVIARRKKFTRDMDDFEKDVLGEGERETGSVSAPAGSYQMM